MNRGASQFTSIWKLQLFCFYIVFAKISQLGVELNGRSFSSSSLYRGYVSFYGGGRRRYLLAIGRYQQGGSEIEERLKSRAEQVVSAILLKIPQQLRKLPAASQRWIDCNLDKEIHLQFLQALILIEMLTKLLPGSLNWAINVCGELQAIHTGWAHWSQLINQVDQKPMQSVALKQLSFKAQQSIHQAELEIIQKLIDDITQSLAVLGIEIPKNDDKTIN